MSQPLKTLTLATALCAGALLLPGPARAWGDEGHEVVGLIAEHFLDPAVRAKVFALLAADTSALTAHDIASESTWADRFRDSDRNTTKVHYLQTRQWHFVDIELHGPDIDAACNQHPSVPPGTPASSGPAADCVVDKIEQFAAELAAPATPADERLLALKFLLHFVGDVHQPLHAGDDHDSGGNAKTVKTRSGPKNNLHHYWDTEFIRKLGTGPTDVAGKLIGKITAQKQTAWAQGTTTQWAMESFAVATDRAYGALPKPQRGLYLLGPSYEAHAVDAVGTQIGKAGVRLATVLNRALADTH